MPTISTPSSNPLLETQVFWVRYKTVILRGALAVLLGLVAFGGYRYYTARQNTAAAALLASKTPADYQKIISDYRGSTAAPAAYLSLAAEQRKEGKFAEAIATLQAFIRRNPKHQFVTTARMAMAPNLESTGRTDEALGMYRRIAAEYPRSFNAPLALLAQVVLLRQKGEIEEARRVCETILTQYRESYASVEASRYLKILKVPSPEEPATPAASAAPSP